MIFSISNAILRTQYSQLMYIQQIGTMQQVVKIEEGLSPVCDQKPKQFKKSAKWTPSQNQIYLEFVSKFTPEFDKKVRRQTRIFKKMSSYMNDIKTAEQCRLHHKKLLENYGTIEKMIEVVSMKIQKKEEKKFINTQKRKYTKKGESSEKSNEGMIKTLKTSGQDYKDKMREKIKIPKGQGIRIIMDWAQFFDFSEY